LEEDFIVVLPMYIGKENVRIIFQIRFKILLI
jgi:hypothetical protein